MARGSRTWGQLRDEVRRSLLETNASASGWTNDLLLDIANRVRDDMEMELQETSEGFTVSWHDADIVDGQEAYSIPEQGGRFRRIVRIIDALDLEIPLEREEMVSTINYTGGNWPDEYYVPTYRLVDNHIVLSPPPTENISGGLRIEMESASLRISSDNDVLPQSWPLFAEAHFVYQIILEALDVEGAQSQENPSILQVRAARYAARWKMHCEERSRGRSYTEPLDIDSLSGDFWG